MSKRPEDHSPALADVIKTMKSILPTSCSVDPEALDLVKKCVSRFISSVSSEAIARSIHQESNAVTSDEIVQAVECIGYDDYKLPIELYLNKFSSHAIMKRPAEVVKAKRTTKHTNGAAASSRAPKPKPAPRPVVQPFFQKTVPLSSSSLAAVPGPGVSSSSSSTAPVPQQSVVLPAVLTASNRTMSQKIQDTIQFAIKHPGVHMKKLCDTVGIPRHDFKTALAA